MDKVFFADGYPRTGCRLGIVVNKNGYSLDVRAPGGELIEQYANVKSARGIARMVEEWCNGFAPRLQDRLDQSASGSMVTE